VKVEFLSLQAAYEELKAEIDAAVLRVLASGRYLLGPELEAFEREFARYVGAPHCVCVGSGLDALSLSLRAIGVRPGDEVLVPALTFVATWLAVTHVGATPVPVEPDPRTYNLDPQRLEDAITSRSRAVIPVHLYGQPADVDAIAEIAGRRGLRVLEDAAQAHGARYRGRRVGATGDVAWSFYPGKNLGAFGDAGAVTTGDGDFAGEIRRLRNYGSREKYHHEVAGWNSRVDELQAAILRVRLAALDAWNARRGAIAALYCEALAETSLVLPHVPDWAEPVWHLFVVSTPRREALREHLAAAGVETGIHYPIPPHLQPAYRELGIAPGKLPISEAIHREVLSLPIGPHLTREQALFAIDAIRGFAPAAGR
jgi:dTDP-4-amino-4,6-dideoxygalactose transaminase